MSRTVKIIIIATVIAAVWGIFFLTIKNSGYSDISTEQTGPNTFTVIGDYQKIRNQTKTKNGTTTAAGRVCGNHGKETKNIFKVGDMRIIVTCTDKNTTKKVRK